MPPTPQTQGTHPSPAPCLPPPPRPAPAFAPRPAPKPNVIFIRSDGLGWADTSPYGSTFHDTPNLKRLAGRGVRFTRAYAASPLCSPTRCSILTGLYPARVGI